MYIFVYKINIIIWLYLMFIKLLYFIYSLLFSFLHNTFNFQYFLCIIFNLIKKINDKNNVLYHYIFFNKKHANNDNIKRIFLPLNNTSLWKYIPLKRLLLLWKKSARVVVLNGKENFSPSLLFMSVWNNNNNNNIHIIIFYI